MRNGYFRILKCEELALGFCVIRNTKTFNTSVGMAHPTYEYS
jgi:hypothetical protein